MKQKIRYALPAAFMLVLVSGFFAPHTAYAGGNKDKTVVIGPIIITPDPAPAPPPKKKS